MPRRPRRAVAAVLLSATLAACREMPKDPSTDGETTETTETTPPACDIGALAAYGEIPVTFEGILPSATAAPGEAIDDQAPPTRHFLVEPDDGRSLRAELFVWLPGSGSEPQQFQRLMNIAAFAGYRSISFAYMNEISVNNECGVRGDPECDDTLNVDCEEQVRTEVIYGDTRFDSGCTVVSRADSIENRLIRLIQYLHAQNPGEGYDAYLDDSGPEPAVEWSRIVIAGWSQGGGHAGLIARDHAVARAVYVSKGAGAVDADGDGQPEPAPWADDVPRATPASRQFGSTHEDETAWQYSPAVFGLWELGDYLNIDGFTDYPDDYARYDCTHLISTAAPVPGACNDPHPTMAVDDCLALDPNGVPILAPAYHYLFAVEVP